MRLWATALVLVASGAVASPPPGSWWNPTFLARRLIRLQSTLAPVPAGYSFKLVFDDRTLGSGNDVRIARWNGTAWVELDRVLDPGSAFQRVDTTLWFQSPAAMATSDVDSDTYLYYDNGSAGAAPADPLRVFLFYDDFETQPLTRWAKFGSALNWVFSPLAHRGAQSLAYGPETGVLSSLVASPPLDVGDVMVEAYWRVVGVPRVDVSQVVRYQRPQGSCYGVNYEFSGGWNIFRADAADGGYYELEPNRGAMVEGVWTRISLGMYGNRMRAFQEGTQINPLSGFLDAGATVTPSGNVGLAKWEVDSDAGVWVDDVLVRRWVDPEPTATLGSQELLSEVTDGGASFSGPRFTTAPGTALTCSGAWSYTPMVAGATNARFSVRGSGRATVPSGLTVDATSGAMAWTPSQQQTGRWVLDLVLESNEGAVSQPIDLVVTCDSAHAGLGCGCGASSGLGLLAMAAVVFQVFKRRG